MLMARPYIWGASPFPKIEALWPPFTIYIHESSTLNKAYGIKVWCYSEPLGNLMEPPRNRKKTKESLPTPKKTQKKNDWPVLSACQT
jgi:hypothetical protein